MALRRALSALTVSALAVLGGCILIYNPDSYRFSDGGGKGGGGSTTSTTSSGGATAGGSGGTTSTGGGTTTTGGQGGTVSACPDGGQPTVEVCGNDEDEDCDGIACKVEPIFATPYVDATEPGADRAISALAMDGKGGLGVAGWFMGTLLLGTNPPPVTAAGVPNGFFAYLRLTGKGVADWTETFGDSAGGQAFAVALHAGQAKVAVGGQLVVPAADGGAPLHDAFVAAATTASRWDQPVLAAGDELVSAVAFDSEGDLITAVHLSGSGSFSCKTGEQLVYGSRPEGVLIVKRAGADGTCLWAQLWEADRVSSSALVVDSQKDPVFALAYKGQLDGAPSGPPVPSGGMGTLVVSLDPAGAPRWSKSFVGAANERVRVAALALGANDRIYASGTLTGTVTSLGLTKYGTTNDDLLVMAFDGTAGGPEGKLLWAKRFGGDGSGTSRRGDALGVVSVGGADSLYVAGQATAALSLRPDADDPTLCPGGGIFLVKLDRDGKLAWGECFGAGGLGGTTSVRLAASLDGLVLGGARSGPISFGSTDLSGTGDLYAFLAHYALH